MPDSPHLEMLDAGKAPVDPSNEKIPDLSYYSESAKFYYDLLVDSVKFFAPNPKGATAEDKKMSAIAYGRMVHAVWGLVARGKDALPYAVMLSESSNRDQKQGASNVWCGLREFVRTEDILQWIYTELKSTRDVAEVWRLISYLGYLRNRDAIPVVAKFLSDERQDPKTRLQACISLGKIVGKRFEKDCTADEALKRASEWLNKSKK